MTDDHPDREPATVEECRHAIKLREWELLRLVGELAERRRRMSEYRRRYQNGRKACRRIWRRCLDHVQQIELLSELVRSSRNGLTVRVAESPKTIPAGLVVLRQLEELLSQADAATETGRRDLLGRLTELQEFAKDFFDYAGVKLVYELGELLAEAGREPHEISPSLAEKVAELHRQAAGWFQGRD